MLLRETHSPTCWSRSSSRTEMTTSVTRRFPHEGRGRDDILAEMRVIRDREESRWSDGFVSGAVYHGDPSHITFMNDVYALNSQANPLHSDLWPSATKYEAEIVAMVGDMLHGGAAHPGAPDVCGTVSSGGTESILLAMKTYRDRARAERGVTAAEPRCPDHRPRRVRQGLAVLRDRVAQGTGRVGLPRPTSMPCGRWSTTRPWR